MLTPKNCDIRYVLPFARNLLIIPCLFCCFIPNLNAQNCPPNIDFEKGNFSGWTCHTGSVVAAGDENIIFLNPSGGPVPGQHEMFSLASPGTYLDYYGNFPVICPNGSGYSVKLGNTMGGAQAEGLSYEFTIPANRDKYTLTYHYAVVFQDPNHLDFQQPRLELEVKNITDNEVIDCSSFTFFPNGSPLPGFFMSPNSDSTAVWCKDWSPVSINLNGKAGKTIRLFFKTADCTFRRHFGYAYIDVDTDCSGEFVGATYCPDDTSVTVTAPYGYQSYRWFDDSYNLLGNQATITLTPPPPPGTMIAVEVTPYEGYGCKDTLTARLIDTLKLKATAGPDVISCNKDPVLIGDRSKQGVVYNWVPATDLNDPTRSNPRASPTNTTTYVLTVRSTGGGCVNSDTVVVKASPIDTSMLLIGKPAFCVGNGDSTTLVVQPTESIQWYRNDVPITGASQVRLPVYKTGTYFAKLFNYLGCSLDTKIQPIDIAVPKPGITYPLQYALIDKPTKLQARSFGSSVLWNPSVYLDEPTSTVPIFTANSELIQQYTIEIRTNEECLTVDTQFVKTIKEVKVYIPTAFTPNNDGLNDFLKPLMFGIKELQYFRIYNRWGQLIYDLKSNSRGWDGTLNGSAQQPGVYVWMMLAIGIDEKPHTQKGTVLLMR